MLDLYKKSYDSIEELSLSKRSCNCLKRAGIFTIPHLMTLTQKELKSIQNFGQKTFEEISTAISLLELGQYNFNNNLNNKIEILLQETKSKKIIECIANCTPNDIINKVLFYDLNGFLQLDISIEKINLNKKIVKALLNLNITKVTELINYDLNRLFSSKGFSAEFINEILDNLKKMCVISYEISDFPKNVKLYLDVIIEDIQNNCKFINIKATKYFVLLMLMSYSDELELKPNPTIDIVNADVSNSNFIHYVYGNNTIKDLLKGQIYKIVKENINGITLNQLIYCLPKFIQASDLPSQLVNKLIQDKKIEENEGVLKCWRPTIKSYIESIEKENYRIMITERLSGKTLEEVGIPFGVTRERIRQVEQKILRKRPHLKEDDYQYYFEKYEFSKEQFIIIFSENENTYNFLNLCFKKGCIPIEEALDDEDISVKIKQNIEKLVYMVHIY